MILSYLMFIVIFKHFLRKLPYEPDYIENCLRQITKNSLKNICTKKDHFSLTGKWTFRPLNVPKIRPPTPKMLFLNG